MLIFYYLSLAVYVWWIPACLYLMNTCIFMYIYILLCYNYLHVYFYESLCVYVWCIPAYLIYHYMLLYYTNWMFHVFPNVIIISFMINIHVYVLCTPASLYIIYSCMLMFYEFLNAYILWIPACFMNSIMFSFY